jgi:hypothetical protein
MLHVRLVSPAALTGRLADLLTAAPGVQNLVVQPGAATRPDGDSVQFDMRDEAANPVFRDLRGLGLDQAGAICVERVDATLADHAPTAGHGALMREKAPVWEMVEATIRAGAAYGTRPVSNLINTPNMYSLIVAILAGLVGVVSLTETRANALIGLNDSGVGRGQLPVVLRRFSAVVSGSRVPGGWRAARCARAAPAPTAPGRPPFRVAGAGVVCQAGAGRAHSRCQQARNASFQGQVRLIFSTRCRAWRTSRAGRLSSR